MATHATWYLDQLGAPVASGHTGGATLNTHLKHKEMKWDLDPVAPHWHWLIDHFDLKT